MIRETAGAFLVFSLAAGGLSAAQRTGATYEVTDGFSGSLPGEGFGARASAAGTNATASLGLPYQGERLLSDSGWEITPGFLGGGPALYAHTVPALVPFGTPQFAASLHVAANTLPADYLVFTSADPVQRPLRASPSVVQTACKNLGKFQNPYLRAGESQIWEIYMVYADGGIHDPKRPVNATVTLPYRDADNDHVVDGTNPPVRASTLSVWWLDEEHSLWVRIPESRVDPRRKTVSAPAHHVSVFTVMGAPDFQAGDAHAFPVPWRPNGPNAGTGPGQTGTAAAGITFNNIPSLCKIRLYTASGDLVRELDHSDGGPQHSWDVKDESGQDVGTGTYFFVVESNNARKSGTLVVVR